MTNSNLFNESNGFIGISPPMAALTGYSFYNNLDRCIGIFDQPDQECDFLPPNDLLTPSQNIKSLMFSNSQLVDP